MLLKSKAKYIQSLGHKKFRDADGVFIAEGPKIVGELLASGTVKFVEGYATAEWFAANEAIVRTVKNMVEISPRELERISLLSTPSQVLAIFGKPVFPANEGMSGITLLLDNIQDPGNLGTIIRTADWFGVSRVICSPDTADLFSSKVVQSTMGSLIRVEVIYKDLESWLKSHRDIPLYAAVLDGKNLGQPERLPQALILIGNESRGIRKELLELASHRIRIPGNGAAESLNAAVAAGILLFMIQKS